MHRADEVPRLCRRSRAVVAEVVVDVGHTDQLHGTQVRYLSLVEAVHQDNGRQVHLPLLRRVHVARARRLYRQSKVDFLLIRYAYRLHDAAEGSALLILLGNMWS